MRENDNHPLTNGTYNWGGTSTLSDNQKRVLRVIGRSGIATLEEVRRSSRHWNQAVGFLRRKGYIEWTNDGRYQITPQGGAEMANL